MDFYLILKNPEGGAGLGDPSVTRVTIIDDDGESMCVLGVCLGLLCVCVVCVCVCVCVYLSVCLSVMLSVCLIYLNTL